MVRPAVLLLAGLCAGLATAVAAAHDDTAARLVAAEVRLGDVVLLRGSTSDDGKPDVDQVWDYLRELRLQPTAAFDELRAGRAAEAEAGAEPVAEGSWKLRRRDEDPWIHLRIAYGGRAEVFVLTLLRDEGGRWRVDPADVARYADMRWIRRSEAARLYGRD